MSDRSVNAYSSASGRPGAEFWFYFSILFLALATGATLLWLFDAARIRRARNPIRRAWAKAWEITPTIFSV